MEIRRTYPGQRREATSIQTPPLLLMHHDRVMMKQQQTYNAWHVNTNIVFFCFCLDIFLDPSS